MAHLIPSPPELYYRYIKPDDPNPLNSVFNHLFDKFFAEQDKKY